MEERDIFEQRALSIRQQADGIVVTDAFTYQTAAEFLKGVKMAEKEVMVFFEPMVTAANDAHKKILARRKTLTDKLGAAYFHVNRQLGEYKRREDEERRKKQAEIEALARKHAEDAALATAVALEQAGDARGADAILAAPVAAAPVVVQSQVPRVEGLRARETWRFRIVDASAIPREFLAPDEQKIGAIVRALKGETRIAGIEVYTELTHY